jgi:hypothetical protein
LHFHHCISLSFVNEPFAAFEFLTIPALPQIASALAKKKEKKRVITTEKN